MAIAMQKPKQWRNYFWQWIEKRSNLAMALILGCYALLLAEKSRATFSTCKSNSPLCAYPHTYVMLANFSPKPRYGFVHL